MNKAGLTDEALALGHRQLAKAARLTSDFFPHTREKELIEIDEDNPDWNEEGREKQFKTETTFVPIPDDVIKKIIQKIPGACFVHILNEDNGKRVYYTVPEHQARKAAFEMGYKVKGHFAAEKHDHTIDIPPTPEEEAELENILNSNKK